jgi:hypothetical protein
VFIEAEIGYAVEEAGMKDRESWAGVMNHSSKALGQVRAKRGEVAMRRSLILAALDVFASLRVAPMAILAAVLALSSSCGEYSDEFAAETDSTYEGVDSSGTQYESVELALSTCPGAGRYCGAELGGSATDKSLYQCSGTGKAPTLYQICTTYCAAAAASKYSFCAKIAKMPAADLAFFAKPNLFGSELLWSDVVSSSGAVTAYGGKNLKDANKFSQKCPDSPASPVKTCTNAGGQCAAFTQFESGAPGTSQWAPLTSEQLSVASAPDGTLVATFVKKAYQGHAMFKCGAYYCDANYCSTCVTTPDNIIRRHGAPSNLSSYSVVGIPGN